MVGRQAAIGCIVGLWIAASIGPARAEVFDPGFSEAAWLTSPKLEGATGMVWATDGSNRLFVADQQGEVWVVKDGAVLDEPFVRVEPIHTTSECGLIGIALDPAFLVNGYVYLFVTVSPTEQQILRYIASGDRGVDRTVLVRQLPTVGSVHNGGAIEVGPDGKLYFGIGDTTDPRFGDDRSTLAAKIGRANLDGTPAVDNPFADGDGPNNEYVWAQGLRNPFSFTFQPPTGRLWVNDVGLKYEQVIVIGRGEHAGWPLYENNQPAGYVAPIALYRTNDGDVRALRPAAADGAVRAGGRTTFTTVEPHSFRLGHKITIRGIDDPSFAGRFFVSTVPGPTTFTVLQPGADARSGGGEAVTHSVGGAIVGGAFYDATSFPDSYRGNFFFNDYTSGYTERVVLDAAGTAVVSHDHFWTKRATGVDLAVGPDGALYSVDHMFGTISRLDYRATAQKLVVSPTNLALTEGQPALVMVRLAMPPAQPLAVTAARSEGDPEIAVVGEQLTFTSTDWDRPRPVRLAAGRDTDGADDRAVITLGAAGLDNQSVTVRVRDDNGLSLAAAPATLTLVEGQEAAVTVSLSARPLLEVAVTASVTGGEGTLALADAQTSFRHASWPASHTVRVTAAQDDDARDGQFTLTVAAAGLPPVTVPVKVTDDDPPADAGPADAASADGPAAADAAAPLDGGADGSRDAAATDGVRDGGPVEGGVGDDGTGCGCRLAGRSPPGNLPLGLLVGAGLIGLARRRGRRPLGQ